MPNWTTNHVEVTGDELLIKKLALDVGADRGEFDFNGIIPMPESLDVTSGTSSHDALACFDDAAFEQRKSLPWFADKYPKIETRAQYAKWIEVTEPEVYELGRKIKNNVDLYGAPTWYEWRNHNWGVKWNASEVSYIERDDSKIVVKFNTPWCDPYPIFDALEQRGLSIRAVSIHEGGEEPTTYGDAWEVFSTWTEVDYCA